MIDFPALAEQAIAGHRPLLELEYHPAALLALDAMLEQEFGIEGAAEAGGEWKPRQGILNAIAATGSFAGEVLRREWGGAWQLHPEQPEQILLASVVFPSGMKIYPLSRVYNRAKSGGAQSLFAWYAFTRASLGKDEGEMSGWVRYGERFEKLGRIDWATRFYHAAARISRDASWIDKAKALKAQTEKAAADAARLEQARQTLASWEAEGARLLSDRGARTDTGCMTLTIVDFLVRELYGNGPVNPALRAAKQPVEQALGAFVGGVLCRQFRAQWQADASLPPEQWSVGWDAGERAQPFAMLAARIEHGTARLVLGGVAAAIKGPCARGACADPPENPDQWFDQAQRFGYAQRLDWAAEFGKMALSYGGDNAKRRFQLADWLHLQKRDKEAADHVVAGLDLDVSNADAWQLCAAVMTALGDSARANHAAETARKMRTKAWEPPKPRPSLEAMMEAAGELQNPGSALVAYTTITQEYPACAEAWRERGVALTLLERSDAALESFERGIALEPLLPKSHDHKAALLGRLKRWPEAFQTIETGLVHCPGSKTLLQRKGIYLSIVGRKAEALAAFDTALALFPGDAHILKLRAEAAAKDS